MSYFNRAPGVYIHDALEAAGHNKPPEFDTEALLQMLNLTSEEPDGLNFLDRMLGGHDPAGEALEAAIFAPYLGRKLVEATNRRTANDAQEELALMLGVAMHTTRA